jgi:arsenate reductase
MREQPFNVLFLCSGNSARSIFAESLLNHWGRGRFAGFSAGSDPKAEVHPMALELLESINVPTEGLRTKSWDEFASPGAPEMDFVFTVCDDAADDVCPVWLGQPMTAHWGIADPAAVHGTEKEQRAAFRIAFSELDSRIKLFTSLPIRTLDRIKLQEHLHAIGKRETAEEVA